MHKLVPLLLFLAVVWTVDAVSGHGYLRAICVTLVGICSFIGSLLPPRVTNVISNVIFGSLFGGFCYAWMWVANFPDPTRSVIALTVGVAVSVLGIVLKAKSKFSTL